MTTANLGLSRRLGLANLGIAWLGQGIGGDVILPALLQCLELGVFTGSTFEVNDTLTPLIVTDRAEYWNNNCLLYVGTESATVDISAISHIAHTKSAYVYSPSDKGLSNVWAFGNSDCRLQKKAIGGNIFINASDSGVLFPEDCWCFIEVDYDISRQGTALRIDGADQGISTMAAGFRGTADDFLYLGARGDGTGPNPTQQWKGYISGFTDGMVGEWQLSDGYGTTLLDRSVNGNDLTLTTDTVHAQSDGAPALHIENGFNIASVSDGVDDYINSGLNPSASDTVGVILNLPSYAGQPTFWSSGDGRDSLQIATNGLIYINPSMNTGVSYTPYLNLLTEISVKYDASHAAVSMSINGIEVWTGSDLFTVPSPYHFLYMRASGSPRFTAGTIKELYIKDALDEYLQRLIPATDGTMLDTVSATTFYNRELTDNSDPLGVKFIPSLASDKTTSVFGETIYNTAGIHHNGAESTVVQQDTAQFANGTQNFYSDIAGTAIEARTHAEMIDYLAGTQMSEDVVFESSDGFLIEKANVYPAGTVETLTIAQALGIESLYSISEADSGMLRDVGGNPLLNEAGLPQYAAWRTA